MLAVAFARLALALEDKLASEDAADPTRPPAMVVTVPLAYVVVMTAGTVTVVTAVVIVVVEVGVGVAVPVWVLAAFEQ